jgi:hypothetical protein
LDRFILTTTGAITIDGVIVPAVLLQYYVDASILLFQLLHVVSNDEVTVLIIVRA